MANETASTKIESFELIECDQCDGLAIDGPPSLSVENARLLLWRRCLDAGWSEAKTTRYLNRVIPLTSTQA